MNKLELYKRISKIHAIKCSKMTREAEAIASFNEATKFKNHLEVLGNDDGLQTIIESVNNWAESTPIATENEIENLLRNGK